MNMSRIEIKEQAKKLILTNKLWLAIGLPILLLGVISALFNKANGIVSILSILTALWEIGVAAYVTDILLGKDVVAIGFGDQIKAIYSRITWTHVQTYLYTVLFIFLWALLPFAFMLLMFLNIHVLWVFLTMIFIIAAFVVVIIKSYEYFLAIYLSFHGIATNKEAVTLSCHLMNGHKGDLFVLTLSFILWQLLTVVTFGLASVFVAPYLITAQAVFANKIIEKSNQQMATQLHK